MKVVLYLALVAVIVGHRPLREMFLSLDRWRQGLLAGLFLLLLTGQIVGKKYPTYPFVKWGMYVSHTPNIYYYEYEGVRADGSKAPFPIADLIRTHSTSRAIECPTCAKRLLWRVRNLGRDRRRAVERDEKRRLKRLYDDTVRAAWSTYKQRHPESDFEKVIVSMAKINVADYVDASSIQRERVWRVKLVTPSGQGER